MPHRLKKKGIWTEIAIAGVIVVWLSYFIIKSSFFEIWYEFTRRHESWELDEATAILFAAAIAGTFLAIRHIFLLNKVMRQLEDANRTIAEQAAIKSRREKLVSLGQLAGGLAHELNNALQPVLGLSSFIARNLKKHGDETSLEYMEIIQNSANHAHNIIENVLMFSHEKSAVFSRYNAFDILSQAIKFCRDMLPSTVVFEISGLPEDMMEDLPFVFMDCDKTGIFQIFVNILKNASDAMDKKGTIHISFKMDRMPSNNKIPTISVTIRDHGCGMNKETLERIFDPFFTTKDVATGTGLGLAAVHGLISQHNGKITVDSTPGEGTTFTLFFPVIMNSQMELADADED